MKRVDILGEVFLVLSVIALPGTGCVPAIAVPTATPPPTPIFTPTPEPTLTPTFTPILPTPMPTPTNTPTLTPTPSDLERAREALISYFSLLHAGHYSEAISYYGGTYDVLRDWNPTTARDDYATLFKNGCTINGLMCLRIRTILHKEEVSPTEFRFVVEFMNDDGTLFMCRPCWGATETEMPSQTRFTFTVKRIDSRFLVMELPVYVP